jgi:predicted ribosome quality control (RQC) complex YloA/Tae2 family protein
MSGNVMEIQIPLSAAGAQIAYDAASAQTKSDHRSAEAASVESSHCNGAEANIAYVQLIFRQMGARGIEVPGQLTDLFEKYKTQFNTYQTEYIPEVPTFLGGDGLSYQLLANDLEVLYDMSKTYLAEEEERIRRLAEEQRRLAEEQRRLVEEQRRLAEELRNEVQFLTQQLDFWEKRLASATDAESKARCPTRMCEP